jgi:hypothetical protein
LKHPDIKDFIFKLFQELHAHINGSISVATMEKLLKRKPYLASCDLTNFKINERKTLDE